jgi:hypothetical protein
MFNVQECEDSYPLWTAPCYYMYIKDISVIFFLEQKKTPGCNRSYVGEMYPCRLHLIKDRMHTETKQYDYNMVRPFNKGMYQVLLPTHLKWSLVPPDFKECCIRHS